MVPRADADALQRREISSPVGKRTTISLHCTMLPRLMTVCGDLRGCLHQDETGGPQTRTIDTGDVQVYKMSGRKSEGTNGSVDGRTQQKLTLK